MKEDSVELSLKRLLVMAAGWDVVALVVGFALRHAKHGVGAVVGAIAWFGLWLGVLALLVLALTLAGRSVRGRAAHGPVR
jgi:hypothetical protein